MGIDANTVKELREKTGLGMMDCKKALEETGGDMEKAIEFLRKKGLKVAEKRAGRETKQGLIESYIHTGGKIGVLIELNCETDFVARTDEFKGLARDMAMQVAAADPKWLFPENVPQDVIDKEKAIYEEQCRTEGKPDKVIPNIVEGKLKKYFEAVCLNEQGFIKDQDHKVKDVLNAFIAKCGENVKISRFVRLVLGGEE